GVMGYGIALMFFERFSEIYRLFSAGCKAGEVVTGKVHVTAVNELEGPRWLVNFPTKRHWRSPSQMAWIGEGLRVVRRCLI
ncbi:Appr-1-p processing protein, partial [Pseudomonas syringae pv. tagetis]